MTAALRLLPCVVGLIASWLVEAGETADVLLVVCRATEEVNNHRLSVSLMDTAVGRILMDVLADCHVRHL